MSIFSLTLAIFLLFGAFLSLWWIVFPPVTKTKKNLFTDTEANVVHFVMNISMSLMLMPLGSSYIHSVTAWVYCGLLITLLSKILISIFSSNTKNRQALPGTIYHFFMILIMLYVMSSGMHPVSLENNYHLHALHTPHDIPIGDASNGLTTLFGLLFFIDAVLLIAIVIFFPDSFATSGPTFTTSSKEVPSSQLRFSIIPHVIMDLGMCAMLLLPF